MGTKGGSKKKVQADEGVRETSYSKQKRDAGKTEGKDLGKKKRKAEAELENSRYQFITNDKKIKKMSKKQLRLVKKLRMNPKLGVVEIVGAYDK